jgi:hypothetical protein
MDVPEQSIVVTSPWRDLRAGVEEEQRQRAHFLAELGRETNEGHPLHGSKPLILARCHHCDDVLIEVEGRLAVVHLTYAKDERPPWPRTQWFESGHEAESYMGEHGH